MLLAIARFEIRYWLRGFMVWIFLLLMSAMIWGAASSDNVTVGAPLENMNRNAPYAIQNFYAISSILTLLMTVAFVNSAAARDFAHQTAQMLFSTPVRKRDFLLGRFLGAAAVAVIPLLGVSLGVLAAPLAPWANADRFGPIDWAAHARGVLVFAIPNVLFVGAVIFTVAALTRSTITSFLSGLLLLVAYTVSEVLAADLRNEEFSVLLDPFAVRTFFVATKYWTVAEKNRQSLGLEGSLLWNRLLWLAAGAAVFAFGWWRFRFEERRRKAPRQAEAEGAGFSAALALPAARRDHGRWPQFLGILGSEWISLVKSTSFIVIVAAALLNLLPTLFLSATEGYGVHSLPVTYNVLQVITGTLFAFQIGIVTYFAGLAVWRERDARMDEVHDALPCPAWLAYAGKVTALLGAVALLQLVAMASGLALQLYHGYHRFQFGLYASELFGFQFSWLYFLAVLAFLVHALSPNKYAGYFFFVVILLANNFIWRPLDISTRLVRYASRPGYEYSDLFGYAPYLPSWLWFTAYWLAAAVVLMLATVLLWPRGRESALRFRLRLAGQQLRGGMRAAMLGGLAAWGALGAWAAYNTMYRNQIVSPHESRRRAADYEKAYKKYARMALPRVQRVRYDITLEPERRAVHIRAAQVIRNTEAQPIAEIHFTINPEYRSNIELPGALLEQYDRRLGYQRYRLTPPLQPGEERLLKLTSWADPRGFENDVSRIELVQNGTFFNLDVLPRLGYIPQLELSDPVRRKEFGLPEKDLMPPLERDCTVNCRNNYVGGSADWVDVETHISTAPDQIAVAPGSLVREWSEGGRRHFLYKLDHPSLNFYSFISARYAVARERWNGVQLEVYHHPEHRWNVPKMLTSMRKSLDYYTKNFGPYHHKQARIIEFPRVARFAQAFPGTMPFSEAIGFIADLERPDAIDYVYFVVAHEMGHQWWAHQVVGAAMQGATLLSETLAEYAALMVMEKEYGADQMHKFLEYEADRYLRSRGGELLKERPLLRVESQQGYIHYQKGGLVMYHLKEMIGEEAVNRALRQLVERFAYQPPPYPTAHHLVDLLRAETPEKLRYLIRDHFEEITLFSNRTVAASVRPRANGGYDVTIEVEAKKLRADAKGAETEVAMDDEVEIGAYAKPEKGKKYGKLLHRERVRLRSGRQNFTFTVAERPEKAGVDPRHLLIDRVPDDNLKRVD
jgi:ABC-type transport system involved in multi-copper enzyme maturation permease subunit